MVFIYYEIKCLLDEMRILDKSFLEPKQARQQPFRIILHTAYLLNRGFFLLVVVVLSFTKFVQFLSCKGLPELAGEGGTRQGGNGAPLSRIEPRSAPGDAVNDSLTLSVRVATR